MDYDVLKQLERELLAVLKEEYTFYQSLYLTLDKQRDAVRFNRDDHLLDLLAEVERYRQRIARSELTIRQLQEKHPKAFRLAAALPEVKRTINSIRTLVKKSVDVVSECDEYLQGRVNRIKEELGELRNSQQILQYLSEPDPSPQFVDGKK
ncbi:MAG TPA: hypothetical protein PLR32_09540 [candidate division Zixibacteria bacterium]|nr:hypothetical protein [candidate division Zixibacteria bacterium]MDD4917166.1 hypothetical protein [candidate division Zixibacteria bacterium]MDM7971632.1 hypothetical protein [candidate division Zixibacteria bacterium]HOD65808.1 hypothetical protein [candidate division Zixibacteria bacterium]HOZ08539.1 hypothetical protein [candidate division Zixibacteria bacterium]